MPRPPVPSTSLTIDNYSADQKNVNAHTVVSTGAGFVSNVFNSCTTATAATTGSASALPTDPAGYVEVLIAGKVYKVPFYNV